MRITSKKAKKSWLELVKGARDRELKFNCPTCDGYGVERNDTMALPPSRIIKPGVYEVYINNVQVGATTSWWATRSNPPKSLQKAIQLISEELNIPMEEVVKQALPALIYNMGFDQNNLLYWWTLCHADHFKELRSLVGRLLEEDPDCFVSLENYTRMWPIVRARMIETYESTYGAEKRDPRDFVELLAEAAMILLWLFGIWIKPEDALAVKEDPKKFVFKPDQVQIDSVEESKGEQETRLPTVPLIPLDLDDD